MRRRAGTSVGCTRSSMPLLRAPRDAEQLDAVAQPLGVLDVDGGELADALGVGLVELHRDAEGDRGEDGELVRGVDAVDVEGGIGLGVAQALRLGEHHVEGQPLVAHLREDVVAGAVDDPGDPLDAVGGEALADRLDDRHAAAHRRLEGDHHALRWAAREDLVAVLREQRLVGGDHVLAVGDRRQDELAGARLAADQLDDDVDVRMRDQLRGIGHQLDALEAHRARLGEVARARGHRDHDLAAGAARDLLAVAAQHLDGAAAHGAQAQQADADRFHAMGFGSGRR